MQKTIRRAALLGALLAPAAAVANDIQSVGKGNFGLTFGVRAGGGTAAGASYFVIQNGAIVADIDLSVPFAAGAGLTIGIDLGYRHYLLRERSPALFLQPGLSLNRNMAAAGGGGGGGGGGAGGGGAAVAVSANFGVGAEYFFAPRFSVGGVLLLSLAFGNPVALNLGDSGLFASFYF